MYSWALDIFSIVTADSLPVSEPGVMPLGLPALVAVHPKLEIIL